MPSRLVATLAFTRMPPPSRAPARSRSQGPPTTSTAGAARDIEQDPILQRAHATLCTDEGRCGHGGRGRRGLSRVLAPDRCTQLMRRLPNAPGFTRKRAAHGRPRGLLPIRACAVKRISNVSHQQGIPLHAWLGPCRRMHPSARWRKRAFRLPNSIAQWRHACRCVEVVVRSATAIGIHGPPLDAAACPASLHAPGSKLADFSGSAEA